MPRWACRLHLWPLIGQGAHRVGSLNHRVRCGEGGFDFSRQRVVDGQRIVARLERRLERTVRRHEGSPDRQSIAFTLSAAASAWDDAVDLGALYAAGHPVIRIELADRHDIAAEFYRWEFATAVAGSIMGINPFDQPDVESAKVAAREIMAEYDKTGSLPATSPFYEKNGIKLFSSEDYSATLLGMVDEPRLGELLSAHFANVEEGDYFAVLGFIEMNEANTERLGTIRAHVLEKRLAATCLGFGPRFLHSTGQAYKGGPNTGVFLQITADHPADLEVPGEAFTFGLLNDAQAQGDLNVLLERGRRALRVHIDGTPGTEKGLDKLIEAMRSVVSIGVD